MKYARYQFTCRMLDSALLPRYKGSMFRGVFGKALKQSVCSAFHGQCADCIAAERCLYPNLFEQAQPFLTAGRERLVAPPLPYVLEPDLCLGKQLRDGDNLTFQLILFGDSNEALAQVILAVEAMGQIGIGRTRSHGRGRFELLEVTAEGTHLYRKGDRRLANIPVGYNLTVPSLPTPEHGKFNLRIITPFRVKFQNHLSPDLPFHLLVRTTLRRISSLFNRYGDGEPPLDYRGLIQRAGSVSTIRNQLSWFEAKRHSNRQEETMLMGGIVGEIGYRGAVGEYLPLFDLAKLLHLGKQTTFGHGLIDYHWEACS